MKILMIAPEPFFSPRGTPLSVYYRLEVLAEMGCSIDLLTYGQGSDIAVNGVRTIRIPSSRWLGPIKVGPSAVKLLLDFFLFLWTVELVLRHRYDVVYAHEESIFFCWALKPLFKFKLVYDMHSSLPQQLVNFGFSRWRPAIEIFRRLETRSLQASDAVITISPALAQYATNIMDNPERHVLIENTLFGNVSLAESGLDEQDSAETWERRLPEGARIIAYAGTLEQYQGIDLLIEATSRLRDCDSTVFLLVIGGSKSQVELYQDLARTHGLENRSLFTGALPLESTRRLVRSVEVFVSPRVRGSNSPLKIYEILASGKPLVATRIEAHTQIVGEEVCFLCEPDAISLSAAIESALEDDAHRQAVLEGARRLYETNYSPDRYRAKMKQVLEILE